MVFLHRPTYLYLRALLRYNNSRSTVNDDEIHRFNKLSKLWWNEQGEMKPLHSMNSVRVKMITNGLANSARITEEKIEDSNPLSGVKLLDVGCGGGILSEALARLGGDVTGLDASEALINVARFHASVDLHLNDKIKYVCSTIEEYSNEFPEKFDVVIASEVIEHVSEQKLFLQSCISALKPGGSIFITTLNKTYTSYLAGIIVAEVIWKILPKNTHDWEKFITPQELECILESYGCKTLLVNGIFYNIFTNKWSWTKNTWISYALHAVKRHNC